MASFLGPALRALTAGRGAHLQGKQVRQEREREEAQAAQAQQIMFAKLMQDVAAKKAQAERQAADDTRLNSVLAETVRHNQAIEAQPRTPITGTPERIAAITAEEEARGKARSKYRLQPRGRSSSSGGNAKPARFGNVKARSSSQTPGRSYPKLKGNSGSPTETDIDAALDRFGGDVEKATEFLRKQGAN